jgi:hypothetical protein
MVQHDKISRRRFLTLGCGAICTAALTAGCASSLGTEGTTSSCPYGEVNDPSPGKCHRYVDQNGNGICDYSEVQDVSSSVSTQSVEVDEQTGDQASSLIQSRSTSRCPKGLVSDPYPGRCHHYVDRDGSGYCDLSEAV